MSANTFDLSVPFLVWFTSKRTEGLFYTEVTKNSTIAIYNIKKIKVTKIKKIILLINMLRSVNCNGIFLDYSSGLIISLIIFLSYFYHISIFMRLRGGMSGEFFDKFTDKNSYFNYLYAFLNKHQRKIILHAAKKIFPVSIFSKSQVLYELPNIDINKIKVFYEPIDFGFIKKAKKGEMRNILNIDNGKKILLTVTGFKYKRKFNALIYYHEAIVKFIEKNPEVVYVILGDGPGIEYFKEEISKITPKYLQNQIVVAGFYWNIYEALLDAELFVYMSHRDAGPGAVKEAQAVGLPVIANYSCFGSNEFLPVCNEIKVLFEEKQELYDSLSQLIRDDELKKKLGHENRRIAEDKYKVSNSMNIFMNELREVFYE